MFANLDDDYYKWGKNAEVYDVTKDPEYINANKNLQLMVAEAANAPRGSREEQVAWSEVEEMYSAIAQLKKRIMTSGPRHIIKLRNKVEKAIDKAMLTKKGTARSAVAWDQVEELDSALAHEISKGTPVIERDMTAINEKIEQLKYDTKYAPKPAFNHESFAKGVELLHQFENAY